MKVKSESEVVQSCLILSNPMDCSLPGSSFHGILQARVLDSLDSISFPKRNYKLSRARLKSYSLYVFNNKCLAG